MTTWYPYEKVKFYKIYTCLFWMLTFETGGESKENAGNPEANSVFRMSLFQYGYFFEVFRNKVNNFLKCLKGYNIEKSLNLAAMNFWVCSLSNTYFIATSY